MSKQARRAFDSLLADNGLRVVARGKHHGIETVGGKYVGSLSCTASDPYALRQAVRELVRSGHLPASAKTVKVV